jgi:hypothetical protein
MHHRDLYEKFAAYAEYVEAGEWHMEGQGTALPTLLIVAPDPVQEARLTHVVRETLAESRRLSAYVAIAPRLKACGPLASIWKFCIASPNLPSASSPEPELCAVFT